MIVSLSVKEVAERMNKSQQFVRIGLQQKVLPFGYAVKMSSKWCYHISKKQFEEYMGKLGDGKGA